jgi:hypothetical protein
VPYLIPPIMAIYLFELLIIVIKRNSQGKRKGREKGVELIFLDKCAGN